MTDGNCGTTELQQSGEKSVSGAQDGDTNTASVGEMLLVFLRLGAVVSAGLLLI